MEKQKGKHLLSFGVVDAFVNIVDNNCCRVSRNFYLTQ